jgi:ADP-ribosylglycohydrolase
MDDNTSQATGTGQQAAAQPTQTAPQAGQQSEQGKAASDEKVFSQSDLNSIIRDRLSKVNEKLTTLQNELKAERDKNADLTSQVENFTNRELANKQGIPSKFTDYAIFEAKKLTSDGNKTFEDAIRRAISLGGDADTEGAIAGALAAADKNTPVDDELVHDLIRFFNMDFLDLLTKWHNTVEKDYCKNEISKGN